MELDFLKFCKSKIVRKKKTSFERERDGIKVDTGEIKGVRGIEVCVKARHNLLQTVAGEEQALYPGASHC